MKKRLLSWTLFLCVSSITLVSCKRDDDTKPEEPKVSSITDERDQKVYKTIKIDSQTWFAENLRYNGALSTGVSFDPYGSEDSTAKYGKLYTWEAARIACPKGWHLPSDGEWRALEYNLGMSVGDTSIKGYDKERGRDKTIGINMQLKGTSGFNFIVRPLEPVEETWTSSAFSNEEKYTRYFKKNDGSVYRNSNFTGANLCVRCLKD